MHYTHAYAHLLVDLLDVLTTESSDFLPSIHRQPRLPYRLDLLLPLLLLSLIVAPSARRTCTRPNNGVSNAARPNRTT